MLSAVFLLGKSLIQLAFFRRKFFGYPNPKRNDEVALSAVRKFRRPFRTEAHRFSVLGSGLYFDFARSRDRNVNLPNRPKNHLDRIKVEEIMKVRAVTLESAIRFGNREM